MDYYYSCRKRLPKGYWGSHSKANGYIKTQSSSINQSKDHLSENNSINNNNDNIYNKTSSMKFHHQNGFCKKENHSYESSLASPSTTITSHKEASNIFKKSEYLLDKIPCSNNNNSISTSTQLPSSSSSLSSSHQEWKKVLYKKQGVPDNYVPPTFLKDLRKNVNLRRFHLMEVIIAASFVTQQIILIVILIMMFIYFDSYADHQYDQILFMIVAIVTLLLYAFIVLSLKLQELKSCLVFLIACFSMSPVLKTLTETISTDTIYAQCTIMAIIHLAFHDYGLQAAIVSRQISLNVIFFASVCLASRLSTTYHAFAFLVFSTDLFVLIALMYKSLKTSHKLVLTATFTAITLFLIQITFGSIWFLVSISFFLFVNIICPYIFIKMQSLKENIYGPWDEAIIDQSKLEFSINGPKINKISKSDSILFRQNSNGLEHQKSSKILKTDSSPTSKPVANKYNGIMNGNVKNHDIKPMHKSTLF